MEMETLNVINEWEPDVEEWARRAINLLNQTKVVAEKILKSFPTLSDYNANEELIKRAIVLGLPENQRTILQQTDEIKKTKASGDRSTAENYLFKVERPKVLWHLTYLFNKLRRDIYEVNESDVIQGEICEDAEEEVTKTKYFHFLIRKVFEIFIVLLLLVCYLFAI
jgi:hypothetical protein